jgi:predicted transposase/invertase (TIGR01784 family)
MKFVDIKNDIAFRKIFGNENKKEILLSFLNAVLELPLGKRITGFELKNPFQLPEITELKSSILDIRVTDERNISYIVEMQVEEPDGFDKRVQYYSAKQYSAQINIGEDYPKLNQVIFIGILNFDFFEGPDFLTRHLIVNTKTGKQELKDLEFNFIELYKFNKPLSELTTLIEKWTYFIKNAPNLDIMPGNVDDAGLKQAYEDADKHSWTKDELLAYDYAAMRQQDEKGKLTLAEKRGIELGKLEMAKEMVLNNEPNEHIMKYTKLSADRIQKLIDELHSK